jgi:hypothetical protein
MYENHENQALTFSSTNAPKNKLARKKDESGPGKNNYLATLLL